MLTRLKNISQGWLSGLWFIPTGMVMSALALVLLLTELDSRFEWAFLEKMPRLFGAGADGSRGMLMAIRGSVITVASLTFLLTITALAQASSQYTSRVLRNFIHNRTNQVVLGFFVGLFSYCSKLYSFSAQFLTPYKQTTCNARKDFLKR